MKGKVGYGTADNLVLSVGFVMGGFLYDGRL
jgi:hypothetical protein